MINTARFLMRDFLREKRKKLYSSFSTLENKYFSSFFYWQFRIQFEMSPKNRIGKKNERVVFLSSRKRSPIRIVLSHGLGVAHLLYFAKVTTF
jgi:hypothetical protein